MNLNAFIGRHGRSTLKNRKKTSQSNHEQKNRFISDCLPLRATAADAGAKPHNAALRHPDTGTPAPTFAPGSIFPAPHSAAPQPHSLPGA